VEGGPAVKDAELIRSIIRLRSADRPADDAVAALGKAELASQPEATIVAIVRGYYEFKSNGYEDADIYREIEGRRQQAYGEEPLPADLNLDNYARYRMRLEYPNQTALHDPIFVMQAVHKAREALEKEYGPGGVPVTFRTMPWMSNVLLVYVVFVVLFQAAATVTSLADSRYTQLPTTVIVAIAALTVAVGAGAVGFVGHASWGRSVLMPALLCQAALPWTLFAAFSPPPGLLALQSFAALVFFYYALRQGRAKPAPA